MQTLCDGKDIQNMTITSETTIEDLELNDRDNFTETVEKGHKTYTFGSVRSAQKFMGQAFDQIMAKCGVKIKRGGDARIIDRRMKAEGVKVEQRTYPPDEPLYRSGLFVYKRGDLMGFVSSPFRQMSNIHIQNRLYIMTTEKDL